MGIGKDEKDIDGKEVEVVDELLQIITKNIPQKAKLILL